LEEKKEIAQAVMNWTKEVPKKGDQPSITWEEIEQHHEGFSCISNADKYLDKLSSLHVYYNTFKVTKYQIFHVSVPHFWQKGQKHKVYVSYDKQFPLWALCDCTRRFFPFSFFSLFSIFHFFLFRELGLCVHIAVAMLVEWRKCHPTQFDAKFKKTKMGRRGRLQLT
jgi:hypothetical protein